MSTSAETAPAPPHPAVRVVDHPIVQHRLTLLRERTTPGHVFRAVLREMGLLLTYEAIRGAPLATRSIETPLSPMEAPVLAAPAPALVSILRAGNGLLDGALALIPTAPVGFVGLYRDEATLRPVRYYCKLPGDLAGRTAIVLDPMLATGNSAAAGVSLVKDAGAGATCLVCLLAAPEGLARMHEAHPDVPITTAAIDERLNDKGYIVPGLGDAGDRMFGT